MKLVDYIRGDRRGKDANSFEMEAMDDPFLSDAIEGYDAVYGDHTDMVKRLENWVQDRSLRSRRSRRRKLWGALSAAAVVLIGAGVGLYMYNSRTPGTFTVAKLLRDSPPAEEISMSRFRGEISGSEPAVPVRAAALVEAVAEEIAAPDSSVQAGSLIASNMVDTEKSAARLEKIADDAAEIAEADVVSAVAIEASETEAVALAQKSTVIETVTETAEAVGGGIVDALATRSVQDPGEDVETVVYPVFDDYFRKNRRLKNDADGNPLKGEVVVEFRVNDAGVPSGLRIVSSFSREANREVLELLVEGPRWTPTHDRRIRTAVKYE